MMSFRAFLESPDYCDLELSPLIAAIADASDGLAPTTIGDTEADAHFGCGLTELPRESRRTVGVRAGGRGGKSSRLLAPKALHAAWTVPVPTLRWLEVASALLVAPDLALARQTLSFVTGYVESSRILSRAVVGTPTKDAIELKRPDGKRVRIEVRAASRGGRSLRGRTLVFAGLDEACFFFDEATGVANDADTFRAVLQRVVPTGQVWIASTGWLAGVGLLEDLLAKNWGTHTHALVCTAGTRALNPTWDPTGDIERDLREQDPEAAIREIDGGAMSGGAGTFLGSEAITGAIDDGLVLPVRPLGEGGVSFGGDLGFVSDSSALVGVAKVGEVFTVVTLEELRPTKGCPLKPRDVINTFAATIKRYGGTELVADLHHRESAREHLEPHHIEFVNGPMGRDGKSDAFLHMKKLFHEGRVRIPNHPRLVTQLRQIVAKPVPGGGTVISSPRHRGGGGHGDLVSALCNALWQGHEEPTGLELLHRARLENRLGGFGGMGPPPELFDPGASRKGPKWDLPPGDWELIAALREAFARVFGGAPEAPTPPESEPVRAPKAIERFENVDMAALFPEVSGVTLERSPWRWLAEWLPRMPVFGVESPTEKEPKVIFEEEDRYDAHGLNRCRFTVARAGAATGEWPTARRFDRLTPTRWASNKASSSPGFRKATDRKRFTKGKLT